MKNQQEKIGERIRQVRERAGLNQEEFGGKIGRKKGAVSKYERGEADPDSSALAIIAQLGGVSLDWLIGGQGPGPGEAKGHGQSNDQPSTQGTALDKELLKEIVIFVEETAEELKLKLIPEKKAQLLIALYEMFSEEGKKVEKETVLRLIKLAA